MMQSSSETGGGQRQAKNATRTAMAMILEEVEVAGMEIEGKRTNMLMRLWWMQRTRKKRRRR